MKLKFDEIFHIKKICEIPLGSCMESADVYLSLGDPALIRLCGPVFLEEESLSRRKLRLRSRDRDRLLLKAGLADLEEFDEGPL